MAVTRTKVDTAAKNGSSIALLFEYGGRRILLGADAHSKVLVGSAAHLTEEERLGIDVLKLPHHGSEKNVTERLMNTFVAKRYVVSTNGNHHEFPDDVAIARVVNSNPDGELVFNYAGPASQRWQEQSGWQPNRFSVSAGKDEDGVRIVVLQDRHHTDAQSAARPAVVRCQGMWGAQRQFKGNRGRSRERKRTTARSLQLPVESADARTVHGWT